MDEFVIDFVYEKMPYTGLVRTIQEDGNPGYSVKLESQNQELQLDITTVPCGDGKSEWCFRGDADETGNFDRALLQEVGEAIEKYQISIQ